MRTEPLAPSPLRHRGLAFATFNVIWTSLAFLLVASPYHYSEAVIGLFGLLGAAGALAASFSGRLADRGLERWVTGASLAIIVGSMAVLILGSHRLWALVVGIVLADLGIQAVHIQNQHLIFAIDPSARSRLNTGYMVTYFIGGALGSAATGLAFGAGGWPAVVILGVCFSGAGLVLWAVSQVVRGPARPGRSWATAAGRPAPASSSEQVHPSPTCTGQTGADEDITAPSRILPGRGRGGRSSWSACWPWPLVRRSGDCPRRPPPGPPGAAVAPASTIDAAHVIDAPTAPTSSDPVPPRGRAGVGGGRLDHAGHPALPRDRHPRGERRRPGQPAVRDGHRRGPGRPGRRDPRARAGRGARDQRDGHLRRTSTP